MPDAFVFGNGFVLSRGISFLDKEACCGDFVDGTAGISFHLLAAEEFKGLGVPIDKKDEEAALAREAETMLLFKSVAAVDRLIADLEGVKAFMQSKGLV